jgi:hypothetical protein
MYTAAHNFLQLLRTIEILCYINAMLEEACLDQREKYFSANLHPILSSVGEVL